MEETYIRYILETIFELKKSVIFIFYVMYFIFYVSLSLMYFVLKHLSYKNNNTLIPHTIK